MIDKLILAWRNHRTLDWVNIGELSYVDSKYYFKYSQKAKDLYKDSQFLPFSHMLDLDNSYESEELFPIFKNRLMHKSRPEYSDYLNWLNLSKNNLTPFMELSRSGGMRATDDLQLFPYPENISGNYIVFFFCHGIRYFSSHTIERIEALKPNDKLFILPDIQNTFDKHALIFRTDEPIEIIGYAPRFFSSDFTQLIEINGPNNISITVERVNHKSPSQFRLLCRFETNWPTNFEPFTKKSFQNE